MYAIRSYYVNHLIIWENTPQKDSNIYELIEKLNQEHLEVRTVITSYSIHYTKLYDG